MHSKVRNIPRNTQLRGRLFDKWPRKGLSGACCGPSGEVSGAPTGRGPACSAARDGDGLGVLRWSRGGTSAFSGAGQGGAGGSAVEPGGGASVFSGAGRGRCRGFCGGAGAGPACSAARDRGGTGSSEVQTGRAGRREGGGGHGQSTAAPPPPKGRCGVQSRRPRRRVAKKVFRREDAPAARTQKKCSEGKVRRRPNTYGHKKKRTSVRSLLFLLHYSATLRASAPGCSSDTPCRTTTAPHSGSPSLLRETSGSMFSCNSLSAFDFGLPVGRGHSRESLRHPEPQPLSRPPVGAQPPGRRNLSRPGSPP